MTDGQVFDRISIVAERYAVSPEKRTFSNTIEIFQVARPITKVPAGFTLRVVDRQRFEIIYTLDDWKSASRVTSCVVGYPGSFADIETPLVRTGSKNKLIFTLHWLGTPDQSDHWLGHNVEIELTPQVVTDVPATVKPLS